MRPRNTVVRLATKPEDYRACRALLPAAEQCWLAYPTVMAYRGEDLVGFLSTRPFREVGKRIVAGPLYLIPGRASMILALRLLEGYEVVLAMSGVTHYLCHVAHANTVWAPMVARAAAAGLGRPIETSSTGIWYERVIPFRKGQVA